MEEQKQSNNLIIKIIIVIGFIIGITSLYLLLSIETPKKPLAGHGNINNDDIQIGGDFELIDQDGKVFHSDNLKGKLSLIYFGFTYCPDICPESLSKITNIINVLSKYKIYINPVFITIDPERDAPAILKEYLAHFHTKFIGLTGSKEQIKQVANKFKVYYAKSNSNDNSNNYMIDHSSFVYLMNTSGKYIKHFYLNSPSEEIIEFIRAQLNHKKIKGYS